MLLAFLSPTVVLVGLKIYSSLTTPTVWLTYAEKVDSFLLFVMILIVSLDCLGKLSSIVIDDWLKWKLKKDNSQPTAGS
jgi:hypothetical protein